MLYQELKAEIPVEFSIVLGELRAITLMRRCKNRFPKAHITA